MVHSDGIWSDFETAENKMKTKTVNGPFWRYLKRFWNAENKMKTKTVNGALWRYLKSFKVKLRPLPWSVIKRPTTIKGWLRFAINCVLHNLKVLQHRQFTSVWNNGEWSNKLYTVFLTGQGECKAKYNLMTRVTKLLLPFACFFYPLFDFSFHFIIFTFICSYNFLFYRTVSLHWLRFLVISIWVELCKPTFFVSLVDLA